MIVDCPSCGATYNISDDKVRGRRVRVRCKSCGDGIIVDGAQLAAEDATRVYSPNFESARGRDARLLAELRARGVRSGRRPRRIDPRDVVAGRRLAAARGR